MGWATLLCKSMRCLVAIELCVGPSYPFQFDLRKVASFPFISKRRRPRCCWLVSVHFAFPSPTQSRQCAGKHLQCYISRYMTALSKTFHSSSAYRCRYLTIVAAEAFLMDLRMEILTLLNWPNMFWLSTTASGQVLTPLADRGPNWKFETTLLSEINNEDGFVSFD